MKERERMSLVLTYTAPAGSMILDLNGRLVGQVVGTQQIQREPPTWRVEVDLERGIDSDTIQILPPAGHTRSVNV
jgi:hypothetical protein